jgi:hypothetical protein
VSDDGPRRFERRSTDAKESSSRTLKEESKRQEGAPIRARRSPAIAAVLILFALNRKGLQTAAKTEWPSTQRDRRKPGQKTKAITDPSGRFVKTLSRIGAQWRKPGRQVAAVCQA